MKLAFESTGSGPPVILLHGLFASAANWRGVAEALATTRRVLCVDLRNHGRSPRAACMGYQDMADDVLRLIESEALDRPAVVGHSMGGKVAMALALTAPYAVGPLVVLDIAPVTYVDRWSHQLRLMSEVAAGRAHASDPSDRPATPGDGMLAELMMPRLTAGAAYLDWRSNLAVIGLSIQELCAFPRQLRYLSSDLPLHSIVGARSDCVSPPSPAAFAPMFPRATVEVIDNAGHWIHADQPTALVRSLRRSLAGISPPARSCRTTTPSTA